MSIILTTERLTLREMTPADIDVIYEMLSDPEVMRYWPNVHSHQEAEEWIQRQMDRYEKDGCGYWLATDLPGRPLGQAGVIIHEVAGQELPGLGYIFRKEAWGQGYATEAARACLDWSRERYPETVCLVQPRNEPSLMVAKRLGLSEGETIDYKGLQHIVLTTGRVG